MVLWHLSFCILFILFGTFGLLQPVFERHLVATIAPPELVVHLCHLQRTSACQAHKFLGRVCPSGGFWCFENGLIFFLWHRAPVTVPIPTVVKRPTPRFPIRMWWPSPGVPVLWGFLPPLAIAPDIPLSGFNPRGWFCFLHFPFWLTSALWWLLSDLFHDNCLADFRSSARDCSKVF